MTQCRSGAEKPGLLISVRNVEEALITETTGCVSIIDIKEPLDGSLGCPSFDTAFAIGQALSPNAIKSVALGEVTDRFTWEKTASRTRIQSLLSTFQFAKIGLAGLGNKSNWVDLWKARLDQIPEGVCRVAVAYADHQNAKSPSMHCIVNNAKEVGCSTLLVDTFTKGQGGLPDLVTHRDLESVIQKARENGLAIVLAGSLSQANIPFAKSQSPDFIAVRGAACENDRTSRLSSEKIRSLAKSIAG